MVTGGNPQQFPSGFLTPSFVVVQTLKHFVQILERAVYYHTVQCMMSLLENAVVKLVAHLSTQVMVKWIGNVVERRFQAIHGSNMEFQNATLFGNQTWLASKSTGNGDFRGKIIYTL